MSVRRGSEKVFILPEWSWNNTYGGRNKKKKSQKKELPCKWGMAWRQNPVTRVRTDWFHVRLLNSVSVWRRHWPSVEGCASRESCWVTSSTCDWRPLPQCRAPPWLIHLDGGVKNSVCGDILSQEASSCSMNSHKQEN